MTMYVNIEYVQMSKKAPIHGRSRKIQRPRGYVQRANSAAQEEDPDLGLIHACIMASSSVSISAIISTHFSTLLSSSSSSGLIDRP